MTLSKKPTRRKKTTTVRRRTGTHHRKGRTYVKAYWPYIPLALIVTAGLLLNSWIGTPTRGVLSYATEMNIGGLQQGTNNQRSANGLGALTLNTQLNSAAQNKAQDMCTQNYWAHVSPTGVTPWYWIKNAGYNYTYAGENLAYGFATSADTITGWMNSAGHRANILNVNYSEIGFGVTNCPTFQGGEYTVIVAMYAAPVGGTPASAPTNPVPTPTPAPTATKPAITAPAPAPSSTREPVPEQPTETPAPTPETTPTESEPAKPVANNTTRPDEAPVSQEEPAAKSVPRVEVITSANVAWSQFAVSMIVSVAVLLFLLRHSFAWHKVIAKGEKFIVKHPFLDIAAISIATLGFVLMQTSGFIR